MLREVSKKDAVMAALEGRQVYRITKDSNGGVNAADLTECLGNLIHFINVRFVADIPVPEPEKPQETKVLPQEEPKDDVLEPAGEVPPPDSQKEEGEG